MKLRLLLSIFLLTIAQVLTAQDSLKTTYPLVISFQSECCGVPSQTSVRNFIISFKKKYKIKKITANHIGPMGREGEYYLAFGLKELSKKRAKEFIAKIKLIKKLPADKGSFSFNEKMEIDAATFSQRTKSKKEDF